MAYFKLSVADFGSDSLPMITRIYADNFRCLVNFDLKLDRLTLLLGPNGSGKTTVFEVVRKLQTFLEGSAARASECFPPSTLTRWMESDVQHFELDLNIAGVTYHYKLLVEHTKDRKKNRVKEETLTVESVRLFSFIEGEAQLYRDNGSEGPTVSFDWERSGLAILPARPDNTKLTAFREAMSRVLASGICPVTMKGVSQEEMFHPGEFLEDFVSWYRRVTQEDIEAVISLVNDLKQALPGFRALNLQGAGERAKELLAVFDHPGVKGKSLTFGFRELSEGQRSLIALYSLLRGGKKERMSLFLDEPDNYVALREVQPWLISLQDACGECLEQAVIISHHPEIIDYLGVSNGLWLYRAEGGHVLVKSLDSAAADGLTLAETIARGWEE